MCAKWKDSRNELTEQLNGDECFARFLTTTQKNIRKTEKKTTNYILEKRKRGEEDPVRPARAIGNDGVLRNGFCFLSGEGKVFPQLRSRYSLSMAACKSTRDKTIVK